ncbi:MAG: molybdenum cofactor guanylyltransferase [Acidobacteriaceae bacterium]|jgi:molybdopterin-guanine dinucleotide biosynthesis protein A|nr:molybdenum cofactor guanylyltransferase [Acidobacteriaceae bacterium]
MITVAILAGGHGQRLGGTDKAALRIGAATILERQLAAARPLSTDILLIGSRTATAPEGVRLLADRTPGAGPLGGLDTALSEARHPVVLLLACDMPYVTTRLLAYLASNAEGVDAVVPKTERGYHPLCAAYTRDAAATVNSALVRGERKMHDVLPRLRVRVVERDALERLGDADRLLTNLNTAADLNELDAVLAHNL